MKYLDLINLLLLVISLYSTSGNSSCSIDNEIKLKVKAIGRPIGSLKVTWHSVNSSGRPVLYQVYYNTVSMLNHCGYPTTDAFFTAKDCGQNSTKEGMHHGCDLTEDYKMLNLNMLSESLCIMISISSTWSNETCYRFLEYNSYTSISNKPICPVPENFQVHSHVAGKLAVNWDVSPKFVGDEALNEMSFTLHYTPVGKLSICKAKETKKLSPPTYHFYHKNNTFITEDLGPCCPFMVTICCAFDTIQPACHPGYVSDPFYVTTAWKEPTKAPQVERYDIQQENLLVKWKIPSNVICTDKITSYEIHYWKKQDGNCSSINSGSAIKKYLTTRSNDTEAKITGILSPVAYCFCIRMCNRPGCGPWSMVYSAKDNTLIKARRNTSITGLTSTKTALIIIGTAAGFAIFLLSLAILIFVVKRRNRPERPRPLQEEVGDVDPEAEEFLDSSQSTTEMDSLGDYATA